MEDYNNYRQAWESYPRGCYVSQFPLHIDIELTTKCNLACPECPYHSKNAPYKPDKAMDMGFGVYRQIIDEGSKKGLKAIKLNFRGEPLLYNKLPEAISYAKKLGVLDVQINTNATLLTKELSQKLITAGLDLLIVSDYDIPTQVENTISLHDIIKIHGRNNPKIHVHTDNPDRWKGFVDEIEPHIYYDYHTIEEVFDKSDFKCEYPFLRFLVLANGDVMSCSCGTVIKEKYLGNIKDWLLESLWHKPEMKFLRICHENRNSELIRMCRICPMRNSYIRGKKQND